MSRSKLNTILIFAGIIVLLLQHNAFAEPAYTLTKKPRIIVWEFDDTNSIADGLSYGAAVSAMISSAIVENKNVLLVERKEISDKMREEIDDINNTKEDKKPNAQTMKALKKKGDVIILGSVSVIANDSDDDNKQTDSSTETIIVDMRIVSLRSAAALTSNHFSVEKKELRNTINKEVEAFIREYLRPYSGQINILITGYEENSIDAEPKTLHSIFSHDIKLLDIFRLKYRPQYEERRGASKEMDKADTIDRDFALINQSFFEGKLEKTIEGEENNTLSVPLINGDYKFQLKIPGYVTSEQSISVVPGETKELLFEIKMELTSIVLKVDKFESRTEFNDFVVVFYGHNEWNGKEKTDKRLSLEWSPGLNQGQVRYNNHKESGYGYLAELTVQPTPDKPNQYVFNKFPIGKYTMYTIPKPQTAPGHLSLEANIDRQTIFVVSDDNRSAGDNVFDLVRRRYKGEGGKAIIFLNPIFDDTPVYPESIVLLSSESSGYVRIAQIIRYGEIMLTGLDKKKRYMVTLLNASKYERETIEIPANTEYPFFDESRLLARKARLSSVEREVSENLKANTSSSTDNLSDRSVSDLKTYIQQIKSPDASAKIVAAKKIKKQKIFHPTILKAVSGELLKGYTAIGTNGYTADSLSWLCNVLGAAGDIKYKSTLIKVAEETQNFKLKQYAYKNANRLN